MKESLHSVYKIIKVHSKSELIYYSVFGLFFLVLTLISLRFVTNVCLRRSKKRKWGIKPINEIITKREILLEVHYAACNCNDNPDLVKRCIQLLRKYPLAVNIPLAPNKYTPFLRACWNGSTELLSYMIHNGADMKSATADGDGPVYLAVYAVVSGRRENFSALRLLVASGCDINKVKIRGGYTALHLAAARGHSVLVGWLLAHGALVSPTTAKVAPRQLAIAYGHHKVASLLEVNVEVDKAAGGDHHVGGLDVSI